MGLSEMERDLAFIRRTMEAATRYSNIPATGYLAIGILGLAGVGGTYALVGASAAATLDSLTVQQIWTLALLWAGILVASLACVVLLSALRARRLGIAAWSSLAARMFLSQIPQVLVAGLLTLGLVRVHQIAFIPTLWLLHYGVIDYSFSYFAGWDHKVQGVLFLALGAVSLLGPVELRLPLLAAGFGGVHLLFGVFRSIRAHSP